jgi:hypothetical protein
MSCISEEPFGQSVPRLMGWSGSPSTCTPCGVTFFALSPRVWMMTPQLTETIRTGGAGFGGPSDFQFAGLCVGGLQVKAEDGGRDPALPFSGKLCARRAYV